MKNITERVNGNAHRNTLVLPANSDPSISTAQSHRIEDLPHLPVAICALPIQGPVSRQTTHGAKPTGVTPMKSIGGLRNLTMIPAQLFKKERLTENCSEYREIFSRL